jgi:hypothetical protein
MGSSENRFPRSASIVRSTRAFFVTAISSAQLTAGSATAILAGWNDNDTAGGA